MRKIFVIIIVSLSIIVTGCGGAEKVTAEALIDEMMYTWENINSGTVSYQYSLNYSKNEPLSYAFNGAGVYYLEHYMLGEPIAQGSNGVHAWMHYPNTGEHVVIDATELYANELNPVDMVMKEIKDYIGRIELKDATVTKAESSYDIDIKSGDTSLGIKIDNELNLPTEVRLSAGHEVQTQTMEYSKINEHINEEIFLPPSHSKDLKAKTLYYVDAAMIALQKQNPEETHYYIQKAEEERDNRYIHEVRLLKAGIARETGDYDTAAAEYEQIMSDSSAPKNTRFASHIEMGDMCMELGLDEDAIYTYKASLQYASDDEKPFVYETIGNVYAYNEFYNDAYKYFLDAFNLATEEVQKSRLNQSLLQLEAMGVGQGH